MTFINANAFEISKVPVEARNDFIVEPGKTEVTLDPGQEITKNITITNRVNRPIKFALSAEDFVGSDNANQPVVLLGDEKGPYSLKALIKPEIDSFTLEFGEKITIPVRISIPLDAEPRGYYGALIVSNEPSQVDASETTSVEGKTRVISRIGSLFLVRVNGEGREEGTIQDFKLLGPTKSIYSSFPKGYEIAYKNSGTVHLVPYGTITVKNLFGKTIAVLPVDAFFALPDATRYREIVGNDGFGIGRYTATLSLNKGYNEEFAEAKIAFWVLPWKVMILIFAGIIVLVTIIYYFLTRFELRRKK